MKSMRRHSERRELPGFAKELISMADDVISHESLSPQEKEELRIWRGHLVSSVGQLMEIFAAHDALQMGAVWDEPFDPHAEMLLNEVLSSAFMISSLAVENPITERLTRKANKERAAYASRARSSPSERSDPFIITEEKRLSGKHPDWSIRRIAGEISDLLKAQGVREMTMEAVRSRLKKLGTTARSSS
jgi:hypothetical protein